MAEAFGRMPAGREERISEDLLKKIENKLEERRKNQTNKIKMENFQRYASYEDDLASVEKFRKKFGTESDEQKKEAKLLADVLEAVIADNISFWLSGNVLAQQTTDYDDFFNGVDIVAEIEKEAMTNYLGLAIDATYGSQEIIDEKLQIIKREIEDKKLSEVDYFESIDGGFKGELKRIPRVVLGLSRDNLIELAKFWAEDDLEKLASSLVQYQIIDEIVLQLETYYNYTSNLRERSSNNDSVEARIYSKIMKIFHKNLAIFKGIQNDKKKSRPKNFKADKVFEAISKRMGDSFGEVKV